jgi:hypothetical protein
MRSKNFPIVQPTNYPGNGGWDRRRMCLEVKTASTEERNERLPPHHGGGSRVRVCMEKVEGDVEATGGEGEGGGARPPCVLPTPHRGGDEGCEGGSGLRRDGEGWRWC